MTKRTLAEWLPKAGEQQLVKLLAAARRQDAGQYRETMTALGNTLGSHVHEMLPRGEVVIVCTVEDADYLARGFLAGLAARSPRRPVHLACYWNERQRIGDRDVAPIRHQHVDRYDAKNVKSVVVVKSIISSACVVRTNLMEILDRLHKALPVVVAAPVMHGGAQALLEADFPASVSRRFAYAWCAKDAERDPDGTVRPGVGGQVYGLLGLGDEKKKRALMPHLVAERAEQAASA
jgi:hypothetical protein